MDFIFKNIMKIFLIRLFEKKLETEINDIEMKSIENLIKEVVAFN